MKTGTVRHKITVEKYCSARVRQEFSTCVIGNSRLRLGLPTSHSCKFCLTGIEIYYFPWLKNLLFFSLARMCNIHHVCPRAQEVTPPYAYIILTYSICPVASLVHDGIPFCSSQTSIAFYSGTRENIITTKPEIPCLSKNGLVFPALVA